MSRRSKIAYGIDCSDRHLVIVRARGRSSFETLAESDVPRAAEGLRRQIAGEIDGGRAISAAALACHETVLRRVAAPIVRIDRALKVLPSLLDVQLPFPLEQCAHVFTGLVKNTAGGLDAMAVAARREDVRHALERLAEVGMDPVLLDHEGLAVWRQAAHEFSKTETTSRAVVHLGPSHVTLAFGSSGKLLGAHSSRLGTDASSADIAARVLAWLRAQASLPPPQQMTWIFSGAGAGDAKRVATLGKELGNVTATVADEPGAFLARALAARALEADDFACNLRTGEQEHAQLRRIGAAAAKRPAALAIAASVALILVNVAALYLSSHRNEAAQRENQKLAFELSGAPAPKGQETLVVQRALAERAAALQPFQRMLAPSASRQLADVLSACQASAASASYLSLKPGSLRLDITGAGASAADKLAPALRLAGWQIQQSKRDPVIVLEGRR